ncbi:unnamed protein product [Pseudo-nitzschia multistriata]|uniref:DUF218 domain-containing protein n=1 Tax=Pseudo-nitzschia multistriata TaxID=183589 RepID=A0A448ZMQ3_9STRA|nr:unnamed protein product [Pseudo-nitzschia multistriata]
MTIPRHLRQRSEFLTSLEKRRRRWSFRHSVVLGILSLALVGCLRYLAVPLAYDYSPLHSTRMQTNTDSYSGERLFDSPGDVPMDLIRSFDAILVLGGGKPRAIDRPPVYVERRCDDAMEIVRTRSESYANDTKHKHKHKHHGAKEVDHQLPILCLSAGTAHMPQLLSADGLPIWESTACAAYILRESHRTNNGTGASLGTTPSLIPPESIFVETSSYDTIGNAYFARTSHTDQNGWRKLLVITNEFHMARTRAIFDWIFSIPPAVAMGVAAGGFGEGFPAYDLYYLESPNVGMAREAIAARKEREASSARSVDALSKKYSHSLGDVYRFLTHDHALYAASPLVDRGKATAADILEDSVNDAVKKSYGLS